MPDTDDLDFDSLFDDEEKPSAEKTAPSPLETDFPDTGADLFSFDEPETPPSAGTNSLPPVTEMPPQTAEQPAAEAARRTSKDFAPDMDALLITAQSSMIIEGMKFMTINKFNTQTLPTYTEAIKGIELYITILERNPNNYHKLSSIISEDIDCREVERLAFQLYKNKHGETPETDVHKLKAYELFRDRLKNAYYKALINATMVGMKKYYLLSGGLDEDKLVGLIRSQDNALKTDISKISQQINIAIKLLKHGNAEINRGMKGKDMNIFIIKASQILSFYHKMMGKPQSAGYYQRLHETYKKYFIVRD